MRFKVIFLISILFLIWEALSPFRQAVAFSKEYLSASTISKGYGFIIENNVADARNKAINDALKNLLKKSLIDFMGFRRYLRVAPLLMETLLVTPQSFIKSYRVLTEKQEGSIYVTSIEGRVYENILRKRLASMGLKEDAPKILIMIVEKKRDGSLIYWWSGVESGIERMERIIGDIFMDVGLSVIDPFTPPLIDIPPNLRRPFLDREEIKRFGDIYGVDFIFYGEIGSDRGDLLSIERKEETWFKFKVFSIATGEVVISDGYKIYSSATETSESILDYEKLSRDMLGRTLYPLVELLREEKGGKRVIEVVFLGSFNYKVYTTIKKAIEAMDKTVGVERVEIRSFSRGRFTMSIEINSDISVLLKGLQEKEWTDFILRLSYIDKKRMILEILPRGGGV